jgi:Archaea-specific editing domain of threonyl-tRNA synthetase
MRGLIFKTNRFYSQDTEKSSWPPSIKGKQDFDQTRKTFNNVICIWLCIEKTDRGSYIDNLVERITTLNDQFYKLDEIVILPFGHLSNNLAHPILARQLIDEMVNKLRQRNFSVEKMSFGTHKLYEFDIAGHRAATSYFEFPYSGRKPEV